MKETPSIQTFLEGPVVYKEAFGPSIIPLAPIQMYLEAAKNDQLSITLSSIKAIKNQSIVLLLNNGNNSKTIQPKVMRNQNEYVLHHTFDRSGRYDLHIKVNDVIIATYVVRVKRK